MSNFPEVAYTPTLVREASQKITDLYALPKVPVTLIQDLVLPRDTLPLPVRIYHPNPDKPCPIIFYYHGGGHVSCSLNTHDQVCRRLAVTSHCLVVSVDYRLAPEYPYPNGLIDCIAAFEQRHILLQNFKTMANQVFLAGDSAGANLALSVSHHMAQQKDTSIKGLALIYPSVDFHSMEYPSYETYANGWLLTRNKIEWYFKQYFESEKQRYEASPMYFKHLERIPPVYIAVAENDPLHDEGVVFAEKLRQLGVPVTLETCQGMIHGFLQLEAMVPTQVSELIISLSKFIRSLNTEL